MAFDPNSPAESHAVLSGDIDQIRENFVQLRKHETGASEPSNLVAGMLWHDTNGPYLKIRKADNGSWLYVMLGTQACVEAGITVTPAQLNDVVNKALSGANADITSMTGLDNDGIPLAKVANAASDGANSDITSLAGLTTPLTIAQGGSGTTGDSIIKAWIQFNGTGTIATQDSFNVTSITDNGTGDYTVTWDTNFANDDYAYSLAGRRDGISFGSINMQTVATGSLQMKTLDVDGGVRDWDNVCVMAIGDQA